MHDQNVFAFVTFVFCMINIAADMTGLLSPYLVYTRDKAYGPIFETVEGCMKMRSSIEVSITIVMSISLCLTTIRLLAGFFVRVVELPVIAVSWLVRLGIVVSTMMACSSPSGRSLGAVGYYSYHFYILTLLIDTIPGCLHFSKYYSMSMPRQ